MLTTRATARPRRPSKTHQTPLRGRKLQWHGNAQHKFPKHCACTAERHATWQRLRFTCRCNESNTLQLRQVMLTLPQRRSTLAEALASTCRHSDASGKHMPTFGKHTGLQQEPFCYTFWNKPLFCCSFNQKECVGVL